ncbi:MAG: Zn-dependent hydrolase [Thermoplasmata archaeon HGW-Thermoplasmata-2]|nr:MAG: Zn-dependent hydrolase [Thermoplasmata archaeon HGW-Thermoplasmata-2]
MLNFRWHRHSCFEVSNDASIVMDPHDGSSIGVAAPIANADVILVSHDHYDHNATRVVETPSSKVIRAAGQYEAKGVKIAGVRAYHDEAKGAKRGEITIFKFEVDGIAFCHMGDTGHVIDDETAAKIGNVDILMLPVGGTFTLDAAGAWETVKKLKPKVVVPMHYRIPGLSLMIQTAEPFIKMARANGCEVENMGNEVELEKDDLPEKTEVWVFSP